MEMCYNGALMMPSNFTIVDNSEMEYIDGGTAVNFAKNLKGLWNQTQDLRWAMKSAGITWDYISTLATVSYWYVIAHVSVKVASIIAIGSRVLAVVAGLGAVAAATYIYNKRIWY